ncbi:MAG: YihY/virulence factor BrkB family protein [Alphaproteobacteria bacterium]|nr:YihY/virulence factor BrkB family protein [Alphaproteobacteria bacterium]
MRPSGVRDAEHLTAPGFPLAQRGRLVAIGAGLATLLWAFAIEATLQKRWLVLGTENPAAEDTTAADPDAPDPVFPRPPAKNIWELVRRVYAEFAEDRLAAVAGGITFFTLLALFPGIASVVSLYGLFGDASALQHVFARFAGFLPEGAIVVLSDELRRLTAQKPAALGIGFFISFGIALWSASGGVKALIDGLNIAFETKERRSLIRLTALALFFTLTAIVFLAAVLFLAVIIPDSIERMSMPSWFETLLQLLVWPLSYFLCTLLMALIYRYAPARKNVRWRWITWGSGLASAFWIAGTVLFTLYVQYFGSYNRTYGSLGSLIGFLTWIWLSLTVLLAGAELNCELERADEGSPVAGPVAD